MGEIGYCVLGREGAVGAGRELPALSAVCPSFLPRRGEGFSVCIAAVMVCTWRQWVGGGDSHRDLGRGGAERSECPPFL